MRLRAAERAVKRDKESVALFPELAKHQTPQARIEDMDNRNAEMVQRWRDHEAEVWRRARRGLTELPEAIATEVRRKWETGYCPGSACYLADMVHHARNGANVAGERLPAKNA